MSNQDIVLKTILDCGTADFCILDDIGYDVGEIIEDLMNEGIKPTLNNITNEVFGRGAAELAQCISHRICCLEGISNERSLDDDEERELELLLELEPEVDIRWDCNCLDTSIYFVDHEDIYRTYLADEIEEVESKMGFSF